MYKCSKCGSTDVRKIEENTYECPDCGVTNYSTFESLRDVIEKARNAGFKDVADTIDIIAQSEDMFSVNPEEQPISDREALVFRTGVVLGVEVVKEQIGIADAAGREKTIQHLHEKEERRLADAFDYFWSKRDVIEDTEFPYEDLPLSLDSTIVFSLGISTGITHFRAQKVKSDDD